MNTFYVKNSQINGFECKIDGEDYHHIKNVLRLKKDEEIYVCDESGNKYLSQIKEYKSDYVNVETIKKLDDNGESAVNITLFQGLPKQDKMDFIVQKCTELGVSAVVPVIMNRTIVKLDSQDAEKKQIRWQKIAKEASRTMRKSQNSAGFDAKLF